MPEPDLPGKWLGEQETACNLVTSTRPDIRRQKRAISVARNTNSKRRPSSRRPRMVMRMIRKGADTTSSGTDARAATPEPVLNWLKLGNRLVKTR